MITLNLSQLDAAFADIARALLPQLPAQEALQGGIMVTVDINPSYSVLSVIPHTQALHITAPKKVLFARGLALAMQQYTSKSTMPISEVIRYERLEVMADCARNAVLSLEGATRFIRTIALMGYTGLQLYIEDVFQLKDYPYFGYMRGAYTKDELQAIQAECNRYGIELIPCLQTLAHLGRALKWNCFNDITDFDDILLVDEPKTYDLIEAMISTMAETLTSRSINLGMDEAHMLGLGKYLDKHGYNDRITIMLRHFNKVKEIADKYGYHSMMWSDMFFRLLNQGSYENTVVQNPEEYALLQSKIPQDVELIYWNYYSENKAIYDTMLDSHLKMSPNIAFAAGAWRWTGPSPYNTYSLHVSPPAHASCLERGIKHVLVTSWGDDGGEASIFSVLPSFQYWAEACYGSSTDTQALAQRFNACTGGIWSDFMLMDQVLLTPENPPFDLCGASPCKYFLYQDILCGLFDKHVSPLDKPHFEALAPLLTKAATNNLSWHSIFEAQAALAHLLSLKASCGVALRSAYQARDNATLQKITQDTLPEILIRIERFSTAYSQQWLEENKVFGLDLFDLRIGGLLQRVKRAITRIKQYLSGEINSLPELEQEILFYDCRNTNDDIPLAVREYYWSNMATASSSRNSKSY